MVGPQRLDKGASDRLAADRAESPSVAWRRECLASLLRTMGEVPEYLPRSLGRLSLTGETSQIPVADLADVPCQPCPGPGLAGFLHSAHRALARPLRSRRARSPSPARRPLQRDRTPHCPLDRPADRGRLLGRLRAGLPPPRSRLGLRARVPATREGHGHRCSSDGALLPMAEPSLGAPYRLH